MKKEMKGAIWTKCEGRCLHCSEELHPFLNFVALNTDDLGETGMCKACHARLRRCSNDVEQFRALCAKAKWRHVKKGLVPNP